MIRADDVPLDAGVDYSIVAHLTEDGMPTASVFVNDLRAGRFIAGLNVFHTAAAPRVDIRLQRTKSRYWGKVIRDVGNGENADTRLWRGKWDGPLEEVGWCVWGGGYSSSEVN